jgi:uncharacterized protein (TIGR02145 family)
VEVSGKGEKSMKTRNLLKSILGVAFIAAITLLFFACGKTDGDFSIVPVKGANGEYQYIDIAQKGKIVINPQFEQAHTFRDGLARVKVSGGKYGYIDKNGKYIIAPTYDYALDFSEGVAWVQLEDQPPMLIDKNGKTILQIDSLTWARPFSNGIAAVGYYSEGVVSKKFINSKGEDTVTLTGEDVSSSIINEGLYVFRSKNSEKWGYKDKNGEIVISEQFEAAYQFDEGVAIVKLGGKYGVIDKKGEWVINPQYDDLGYCEDGLFKVKVGNKWGWLNKKGEIVINPQFDETYRFYGNKLAPVRMGTDKWGYIDKKGQILINPQFKQALPFSGNYAMIINDEDKIGFINQKGDFVVSPLYDKNEDDAKEYLYTIQQKKKLMYYLPGIDFGYYERLREKYEAYAETFASVAKSSVKSFTDSRDGIVYKYVKIDTQTWMAENLNYATEGSKCYEDKPANCKKYGRLYNWSTAMKVCPAGWHLPSNEEWDVLYRFVDMYRFVDRKGKTGKYLKATSGWSGSGDGTDSYGFAALPGGVVEIDRKFGEAYDSDALWGRTGKANGNSGSIGNIGGWWSSSEDLVKTAVWWPYGGSNIIRAYKHYMTHGSEYSIKNSDYKRSLLSVRCLKN